MVVHNIKLIYDEADGTVKANRCSSPVRKGDLLNFECDLGPVRILMIPCEQFSAGEFSSGDSPVVVNTNKGFQVSAPRPLFATGIIAQQSDNHPYVVTGDGNRFLVPVAGRDTGPVPDLVVVMNWLATRPR